MFNLSISKRNNSHLMSSMNDWIVNGKVISESKTRKGMWLTIKSKAIRKDVYASDTMRFDCFVPKNLVTDEPYRNLHAKGRFEFKKDEVYFVVEEVL